MTLGVICYAAIDSYYTQPDIPSDAFFGKHCLVVSQAMLSLVYRTPAPHPHSHLQPQLSEAWPGPCPQPIMMVPGGVLNCETGLSPPQLEPLVPFMTSFSDQLHPTDVSPRLLSISGFSSENVMALMTGHFPVSVSTGPLHLPTRQQVS